MYLISSSENAIIRGHLGQIQNHQRTGAEVSTRFLDDGVFYEAPHGAAYESEGRVVGPCWEELKPKGPKGSGRLKTMPNPSPPSLIHKS